VNQIVEQLPYFITLWQPSSQYLYGWEAETTLAQTRANCAQKSNQRHQKEIVPAGCKGDNPAIKRGWRNLFQKGVTSSLCKLV